MERHSSPHASPEATPQARRLLLAGAGMLVVAGLLLWFREGEKLFAEGLIAFIAGCF